MVCLEKMANADINGKKEKVMECPYLVGNSEDKGRPLSCKLNSMIRYRFGSALMAHLATNAYFSNFNFLVHP